MATAVNEAVTINFFLLVSLLLAEGWLGGMPALPYLPFTVEEAASVTCLAHWSNTRARVVGRVVAWSPGAAEAELEAQGEGEVAQVRGTYRIVFGY